MPEPEFKSVKRLQKFSEAMQKQYKLRDFKGDAAKVKAAAKDVQDEAEEFVSNLGEMATVGASNLNERLVKPASKTIGSFTKKAKSLL